MAREVLGKVGLGYSHCEVAVVTDPQANTMMGPGAVFLTAEHFGEDPAAVAVWLDGTHLDKLIELLRQGKRKLLEAGAAAR